ncbi:MAG: Nif3-like dinuclear metal center hexameric protein [Candidatus Solibacter sp.]|nr:Nif3-like dinuclear metal center hexameric protein [Candidatus Solibacter sp.]
MAISAQQVVDRIQQQIGPAWKSQSVDIFHAGDKVGEVTGIVTTFAPSLEVLRRAVEAKKNMIVSREAPFWARGAAPGAGRGRGGGGGRGPTQESMDKDPTYRFKRDFIAANNLVLYRLFDNWNARRQDGQLLGLARALGWEKNYKPSGGEPWARGNGFFSLPPATLKETAAGIKKTLKMKSIRIVGDPNTRVTKAALSHGMYQVADLEKHLGGKDEVKDEAADKAVSSGQKKGLIVLGSEVSEEPGCGEMANWLKTFIKDVPVEWFPTGEPAWMPY